MEEIFVTKDGRSVKIFLDESKMGYVITAIPVGGVKPIGSIEFDERDDDDHMPSYLKMVWAYLDMLGPEWKFQGIGTRCVELAREWSGLEIVVEDNDGYRKDDGSHLTGDAPGFIARLRERKIIA